MKAKTKTTVQKKRYGQHHKKSSQYHSVYWPYIPMMIILSLSFLFSGYTPKGKTLAYATNVSISGLLQSTNAERVSHGVGSLAVSQALNAAAQAKADDMVARNYWSHNTPEGQEPWVFFDSAGYSYSKAGENLAYGFGTSSETITGWMNSPSHRANLLDAGFVDVGFGFANGSDFNDSGQETVVVAMYGKPLAAAVSTPPVQQIAQSQAPTAIAPAPPTTTESPTTPTPTPSPESASQSPSRQPETLVASTAPDPVAGPTAAPSVKINAEEPLQASLDSTGRNVRLATAHSITQIESLTKGAAPWAVAVVSIITALCVVLALGKHGLLLHKLIKDSENLILHHPLFDSTVLSLIVLGLTLLRDVGFVR